MERRSAIALIALAGALMVVMVSCATGLLARRAAQVAPQEATPATEEETSVTRWRIPEPDGMADELRTRAWEAADGSGATLSVRGGAIVERSATGDVAVTAFQVLEESGSSLSVRCIGEGGAVADREIEVGEGFSSVSSDAFSMASEYREVEGEGAVRIEGVPEAYLSLVGDWQGFAHGVEAYCSLWVPDAATASFFPEVSLDTASGRVTATLSCDDPASTTVAVTWDGTTFEVSADGR